MVAPPWAARSVSRTPSTNVRPWRSRSRRPRSRMAAFNRGLLALVIRRSTAGCYRRAATPRLACASLRPSLFDAVLRDVFQRGLCQFARKRGFVVGVEGDDKDAHQRVTFHGADAADVTHD